MHVRVDPDICICAGHCVLTVPEVFDQDDVTATVVLLQARPAEKLHASVREAAQLCPASAITFEEEQ